MTLENRLETLLKDAAPGTLPPPAAVETAEVPVDALAPGRYQPRRQLSEERLAELADSIREQGILQPIVVRRRAGAEGVGDGAYEIVAGERRWHAA